MISISNANAEVQDFDTGAGVDNVVCVGLVVPASGGAVPGGTSTNPLQTQPAGVATVASPTVVAVASSATNVTLKAANTARKGLLIFNDSTAALHIKFGATATTTTSYTVKVAAGGYYEVPTPVYTGIVDGIWASANGNALVTELV